MPNAAQKLKIVNSIWQNWQTKNQNKIPVIIYSMSIIFPILPCSQHIRQTVKSSHKEHPPNTIDLQLETDAFITTETP